MAKKPSIITDFSSNNFTEAEFSMAVGKTVTSLTKNSGDFPGLPVAAATVDLQLEDYNKALNAPVYANQTSDIQTRRAIAEKSVTDNGVFINRFANGDASLLNKSGYPVAKKRKAQTQLPQTVLTIKVTNAKGQLQYVISKVKGRDFRYGIFYTLDADKETNPLKWRFLYCPSRKGLVKELDSKADYKFVSVALGTSDELTLSEPVRKSPQ